MDKNTFSSRLVYNRTDKPIVSYNCEGNFIELLPVQNTPIPDYKFGVVYIVTSKEYHRIKKSGRRTDDLIHVMGKGPFNVGRCGIKFSYLQSFDNLSGDEKMNITPCSELSYQRNDPWGKAHRFIAV